MAANIPPKSQGFEFMTKKNRFTNVRASDNSFMNNVSNNSMQRQDSKGSQISKQADCVIKMPLTSKIDLRRNTHTKLSKPISSNVSDGAGLPPQSRKTKIGSGTPANHAKMFSFDGSSTAKSPRHLSYFLSI